MYYFQQYMIIASICHFLFSVIWYCPIYIPNRIAHHTHTVIRDFKGMLHMMICIQKQYKYVGCLQMYSVSSQYYNQTILSATGCGVFLYYTPVNIHIHLTYIELYRCQLPPLAGHSVYGIWILVQGLQYVWCCLI